MVAAFLPGNPIVLRERWDGRIFEARPMTVVEDDERQLTLYLPGSAECALPIDESGDELRLPDRAWRLELRRRGPEPILSFAWPGRPYAVLLWHGHEGRRVWYVNLEDPLVRTPMGFDTVDHALDVIIELDGSSWRWKDEDELARAVEQGLFTEADAAAFYHWGERAVEHVVSGRPPFDKDWSSWGPDPAWPEPRLRSGWNEI